MKNYFAAEIDKHAIKVTQSNYADTIQLGDVTQVRGSDLPKIDLVIGGSPCQGFSFAGKQLAFDDPRSRLFFEFVRLLDEVKPRYFLLENVRMKKEFIQVISDLMLVEPLLINSALVSAQNRKRLYWTNIPNVEKPEDLGLLLIDILEPEVDTKYYVKSDKLLMHVTDPNRLRKKYTSINSDKAITQIARQYANWGGNYVCVASRGRNPENPTARVPGQKQVQMLEPNYEGKTNCLTSVRKDNMVFKTNYLQWDTSGKGHNSQQDRAWYDYSKHGALPYSRASSKVKVITKGEIRRLTPVECERLQTVPDNYTSTASDTQRYKMLGNGWTVDVIAHIFKNMDLK